MEKKCSKKQMLKAMLLSTIPVITGYIFGGMAFGIVLSDKGYSIWSAFLMSTTMAV
jgi:predicted branched-subunit amino acid permease